MQSLEAIFFRAPYLLHVFFAVRPRKENTFLLVSERDKIDLINQALQMKKKIMN